MTTRVLLPQETHLSLKRTERCIRHGDISARERCMVDVFAGPMHRRLQKGHGRVDARHSQAAGSAPTIVLTLNIVFISNDDTEGDTESRCGVFPLCTRTILQDLLEDNSVSPSVVSSVVSQDRLNYPLDHFDHDQGRISIWLDMLSCQAFSSRRGCRSRVPKLWWWGPSHLTVGMGHTSSGMQWQ